MMDPNTSNGRDEWYQASEQTRRTAAEERRRSERLAKQLSRECMQQWQRSIEGMLAIPTAAALGIASSTLYVAAFLERGFEAVQASTEALRTGMEQGRREFNRADSGDDRRMRDREPEDRRMRDRDRDRPDVQA